MTATLIAPSPVRTATVELVSSIQDFAALREEWNDVLQTSAANCVFLTWEWLFTWWKHLGCDRELAIYVVRSGDLVIGIAPLAQRPSTSSPWYPMRALEFLGSGLVGSDYLDVIVRQGYERQVWSALGDRLAASRTTIDFTQLEDASAFALRIGDRLEQDGWLRTESVTNVCPFISLAGKSKEQYFESLSSEHRYNFGRKLRRMTRDHAMHFDLARTDVERREALEHLIHLHNLRRDQIGGSDAFHKPELVEFHREFSELALRQGWLRLYTLFLKGEPAACLYGLLYNDVFYFYQSGLDPRFEKLSPGLVTMGLSIREAIDEGAVEFDMLHGDESYKSHWARERRELMRLELDPPGAANRMRRASIRANRAARKTVRDVLRLRRHS